jgi:hypothetical protein
MQLDDYVENTHAHIVSRRGYILKDLVRAFIQSMGDSGPVSAGKLLHYTADMCCSGGIELLQKLCWEYAYDHIGISSPRIFYFLYRKFRELNERYARVTLDVFCKTAEIQQQIAEIVLILQGCPKRSKTKLPSVPDATHENENWLRSVLRTTDKAVVRKVWQRNVDSEQMLHAGNEMVFAIIEGATERTLFWVKWLIEEDNSVRKRFGTGLTTIERGPPSLKSAQRASVGYYIIAILAERYDSNARGIPSITRYLSSSGFK